MMFARDETGSSAFHPQAHWHSLHTPEVHLPEGSSPDLDQVGGGQGGTLYSGCSGCGPLSHILNVSDGEEGS